MFYVIMVCFIRCVCRGKSNVLLDKIITILIGERERESGSCHESRVIKKLWVTNITKIEIKNETDYKELHLD